VVKFGQPNSSFRILLCKILFSSPTGAAKKKKKKGFFEFFFGNMFIIILLHTFKKNPS
jgi:hypothetical protein